MAQLKDFVIVQPKSKIKAGEGLNEGEYKFFTSSNTQSKWLNQYQYDNPALIFGTGGMASVHFCDTPFSTSTDCIVMYAKGNLNLEYVYRYLESHMYILENGFKGVGLKHVSKEYILSISIPEVDFCQQESLIASARKIDGIICARHNQLAKMDELVKARFVELFGSLNGNEKALDIVSIEELCTLIKDGTHQTPTYTEDKQNGFKFLSSKDVMTQKICWDDIKYIPAELHEKLYATIQPQRNDIIMSKNGVNYGVAAVNDTDEVFDVYVSLALLRPRTDMVNPVYLRCAINNPDTKHQFDSSIKGIGVPNLHLGEIKKTKVLLPPIDKQNEFVAFVEQTDKSKLAIQKSLDKLETMKKALMQQYFG